MQEYTLHTVTVGDDPKKAHLLLDSFRRYGHADEAPVGVNEAADKETAEETYGTWRVLGAGRPWKGGTMAGPGGGQKINLMKEFLRSRIWTDTDLILFSDGYDSTVCGTPADFIQKWKWFNADVVFGAEETNWPGQCTTQPTKNIPGRFLYLNSGGYIGRAQVLQEMFESRRISDAEDDQLFCQELYASGKWNVKLDHRKEIFCCLSDHIREHRQAGSKMIDWPVKNIANLTNNPAMRDTSSRANEIYYVAETNTYPLQLHGNGMSKGIWREIINR